MIGLSNTFERYTIIRKTTKRKYLFNYMARQSPAAAVKGTNVTFANLTHSLVRRIKA